MIKHRELAENVAVPAVFQHDFVPGIIADEYFHFAL